MAEEITDTQLRQYDKLFIGGEWVEPASGGRFETVNPANGQPWAVVPEGDARAAPSRKTCGESKALEGAGES